MIEKITMNCVNNSRIGSGSPLKKQRGIKN